MGEDSIRKLSEVLLTEIISTLPTGQCVGSSHQIYFPCLDIAGFYATIVNYDLEKFRIVGLRDAEDSSDIWDNNAIMKRVKNLEIDGSDW